MLTVPLRFMIAGIAFSLEVLGQWEEADSLHWMDSVLAFISRHTLILQRVYKKINYISLCFLNESAFDYGRVFVKHIFCFRTFSTCFKPLLF